jgi:hypothetical protein
MISDHYFSFIGIGTFSVGNDMMSRMVMNKQPRKLQSLGYSIHACSSINSIKI